ncbi:uncharacterized protein LOC111708598 [Eurytemora carolleeae]|uniref:uncharacterized protein LOC111708598 n=1 Tax=Eurytemora carolleeae TaxID=1294199 RepID=UPI000C7750B1|nr:uncharacterized protein LOC111708598 [Eurytemora carolleeae]|eukprot:XP_023337793.1 uncharacterized protein LOC111708598 [Eurytemora affinis]
MSRYTILGFLFLGIGAVPFDTESRKEVDPDLLLDENLKSLAAEFRESVLAPLLVNPLQITALTCGSVFTFYNSGANTPSVSLDLCLLGIIIAKILVVSLPVLFYELNNVRREGGVMSDVLGNLHDIINNIDFQGSGPEGEPFGLENLTGENSPLLKYSDQSLEEVLPPVQEVHIDQIDNEKNVNSYTGFGFSDWSSGIQTLSELNLGPLLQPVLSSQLQSRLSNVVENSTISEPVVDEETDEGWFDYLPRSFSSGRVGISLRSALRELSKAVHVEKSTSNTN